MLYLLSDLGVRHRSRYYTLPLKDRIFSPGQQRTSKLCVHSFSIFFAMIFLFSLFLLCGPLCSQSFSSIFSVVCSFCTFFYLWWSARSLAERARARRGPGDFGFVTGYVIFAFRSRRRALLISADSELFRFPREREILMI